MLRLFRHYLSAPALLLLSVEATLLMLVVGLLLLRFGQGREAADLPAGALPVPMLAIALLWSIGLYDRSHLTDCRRAAGRLMVAFLLCWPLLTLPLLANGIAGGEGTGLMAGASAAGLAGGALSGGLGAVFALRLLWGRLAPAARLRRRILVVGTGERAARIEACLQRRPDLDAAVIGFVQLGEAQVRVGPGRVVGAAEGLAATARRLGAHELVVAVDERRGAPVAPLLRCRLDGMRVTDHLSFWERETGQVMLEALEPSWLIYSDGFRIGGWVNRKLKRLGDVAFAGFLLIATAPLMAMAALAVRLDSPGPVLFRQERSGHRGRAFVIHKFRTMRADAERDGRPRWAAERDPRITRVGNLLRKTRIDELPQLWNVIKGEMSFIGPRPERPFFVERLAGEIPYYRERHRVRPGITGWAQVNYPYGASVAEAREKLAYDLYYIKNYSLLLDMLVLLATVEVVLWPKGVR